MSEFNFFDLQILYRTGRAYTIRGEGRNRVTGYRHGVMCGLGDIEEPEWCQMAKDLIGEAGEQDIHQQLLDYLSEHNYRRASKSELEFEALRFHVSRIFDDPLWVGFIRFNSQYRPEFLKTVKLAWVMPKCCKKPGQITQAMLDRDPPSNGENFCPHCGRWTQIQVLKETDL